MIMTRSPLRISLGGGGTDLPSYYERFGGALIAAWLMRNVLYGSGLDPVTFVTVPIVLGLVALLAIFIPARRASAVNPVVVLRQE